MKSALLIALLSGLSGCAMLANAPVPLSSVKKIEGMSRDQVIEASKQCTDAKLKPVVRYVFQPSDFGRIQTPIDVQCETYRY